jgi:hypothetical protein
MNVNDKMVMVFLRYPRVRHLLVQRLIVFQVQVHMMVHTILCQQPLLSCLTFP